jgi:hypothetical protein
MCTAGFLPLYLRAENTSVPGPREREVGRENGVGGREGVESVRVGRERNRRGMQYDEASI